MKYYRLLILITFLFYVLSACSKHHSSPTILVYDGVGNLLSNSNLHGLKIRKGLKSKYLRPDSLKSYMALLIPSSQLNQLDYQSLNALKRYLEAGGGLILLKDEPINKKGWPWLQKWNRKKLGNKLNQDRGRLYVLSPDATRQQLKEGLAYVTGEGLLPSYKHTRTLPVPDSSRYTRNVLTSVLDEPMQMAVLPNKDVLFVERKGDIKLYDSKQKKLKSIAHFEVFSGIEDGLLGVVLDPDYTQNHWVYFYYAAPDSSASRLSRIKLQDNQLYKSSEQILLEVPTQRKYCCHSAGYLGFGPGGLLYLAVGDNTNADDPYKVGYPPVDERPGHELADDQATAANTMDLRGKILRIKPKPNGEYAIPKGNLFPKGTPKTRPEIYTMGLRNPFRFTVDQQTGILYWGEVGPNTNVRGRDGTKMSYDELNRAAKPGFYGWPYFLGNNDSFPKYDFATREEGAREIPSHPINDSPNSTGLQALPPAQPPMVWYGPDSSQHFPKVGSGGASLMAGFVYHSDRYSNSPYKLSSYYDGKLFIYDWIRNWIMAVTLDSKGRYVRMEPFLDQMEFASPMDMQLGPDGALYVLEYGSNWFSKNKDAKLVRIEYKEGNRAPIAVITADKTYGGVPLTVHFSAGGSKDYDKADNLNFKWNLNGETLSQKKISYTFKKPGNYTVGLTAEDNHGTKDTTTVHIKAGNSPPSVQINSHSNKSFYWDHSSFDYYVNIEDDEDTLDNIDASHVQVSFGYLKNEKDVAVTLSGNQKETAAIANLQGKKLISSKNCSSCHSKRSKSVGPSYMQVAKRYNDTGGIIDQLVTKIIQGGTGNWGNRQMPPHPKLPGDDAREIVRYILSLDKKNTSLPMSDTLHLNKHNDIPNGAYLLSATYIDHGANGIPPLKGEDHVVLRNPRLQAENYDEGTVKIVHIATENRGYIDGIGSRSYIKFNDIDLQEIQSIRYRIKQNGVGGTITLHLDTLNGKVVSTTNVAAKSSASNLPEWQEITSQVENIKGKHDLYFLFTNIEKTKKDLFAIDWIYLSI